MDNRTCAVEGCDRSARTRGWCQAHYFRWRRNGDPGGAGLAAKGAVRLCAIEGCDRKHLALGLCDRHFQRYQRWGDPYYTSERAAGEFHWAWRGDEVGYGAAHERVRAVRGSASEHSCCACGGAATQWAYDHEDASERLSDVGPYSVNPDHYRPMCVPCHKRFDLARLVG